MRISRILIRTVLFFSGTGLLVSFALLPARGQALGAASYYNVYVVTNDTMSGDAQGAVAVGGNATFTQYSVADNLPSNSTAANLVVGGTLTATGATVNGSVYANSVNYTDPSITGNVVGNTVKLNNYGTVTGNVQYQTSYSNPNTGVSGTVKKTTYTSPINFSSTDTTLYNDSSYWATLAPTAVTTDNYDGVTLTATGGTNTYAVFDVTGTQLSTENNLIINAPAGTTVLVDVSGTSDTWGGGLSLSGGIAPDDVIYNFYQASNLSITGIDVQGSVLAPDAVVNFASGQIHGNLIANSLSGGGEAHNSDNSTLNGDLFAGILPNGGQLSIVPEPGSKTIFLLAGVALLGLMVFRKTAGKAKTL